MLVFANLIFFVTFKCRLFHHILLSLLATVVTINSLKCPVPGANVYTIVTIDPLALLGEWGDYTTKQC